MNKNGRKLIDFGMQKILSAENTFSEEKDIHKFTWMTEVNDREDLLDFTLVEKKDRKTF